MFAHRPLTGSDKVVATRHIREQIRAKGFSGDAVIDALCSPYKVTEVRRYPGQVRFCGAGLAVVVRPENGKFFLVTVYEDGVVTPMREDQKADPAALASARLNR